jgi:hypothetical protein
MDEKLEKALKFANFTRTFEDQKSLIKEAYFESMIHYTQGGQFTINQTLLTFVNLLLQKQDSAIIVDDNNNPIQIEKLEEFYDDIVSKYFEASNIYYSKVQSLKSNRSVEKLVNYEQ